jgi:type I site-specific restriction-modification system R (restriction) subunit
LHYIDWQHPENNVYHVCDEFVLERRNRKQTRRPDIVLFVNGIPLLVIECKRPDSRDAAEEGISQHLRNQRSDEIPELFTYSQLLLSVCQNKALYGTTGTPSKFWAQVGRKKTRLLRNIFFMSRSTLRPATTSKPGCSRNGLNNSVLTWNASGNRASAFPRRKIRSYTDC